MNEKENELAYTRSDLEGNKAIILMYEMYNQLTASKEWIDQTKHNKQLHGNIIKARLHLKYALEALENSMVNKYVNFGYNYSDIACDHNEALEKSLIEMFEEQNINKA